MPTLDAEVALAKQRWEALLKIRPIEALVRGDKGDEVQSSRATGILRSLYGFIQKFRSVSKIVQDKQAPFISLAPTHAEFLRNTLFPNFNNVERAYLYDSEFGDLVGEVNEGEPKRGKSIEKSMLSIAKYADGHLDEEDVRRTSLDVVFDTILEESFQPDDWAANRMSIRPIILGIDESRMPIRIKSRLTETHKAFIFGACMAAIALCRSVVEFVLIERAPRLGFKATYLWHGQSERYLPLEDLISNVVVLRVDLESQLRLLQGTGNRILHPKKKGKHHSVSYIAL